MLILLLKHKNIISTFVKTTIEMATKKKAKKGIKENTISASVSIKPSVHKDYLDVLKKNGMKFSSRIVMLIGMDMELLRK